MTNKTTKRALLSSMMALFLCFTMLIGTTYAWFTDEVTSANNIIQTGNLDIEFYWAQGEKDPASAAWTNAAEGPIFEYANWEPGYAVARHLKVTNAGTLAFNYQMRIVANGVVSDLANVIDVYVFDGNEAIDRYDLKGATPVGTLMQVLLASGGDANVEEGVDLNDVLFNPANRGSLEKGEVDYHTIVFAMQEDAGNEYQNMDLGCTFSVEMIAAQKSFENDSFGPDYDVTVPDPAIPAALVRPMKDLLIDTTGSKMGTDLGKILLDTGYQFEPTSDKVTAESSQYQLWHADFVVFADRDVPKNSLALAGYYDAWCELNNDKWVALTHGEDIPANTEIRLVASMLNGGSLNWKEISEFGNDGIGFRCGAVDLTGVNAGTTLTVQLRLYPVGAQGECANGGGCTHPNTDCELDGVDYITVGEFKHTFTATVGTQAELKDALANGANLIDAQGANLGTFSYMLNTTNVPAGETVVIKNATVDGWNYGNAVAGTVVFENCKFTSDSAYSIHFDAGNGNVVFNNCELEGWCAFGSAIQSVTLNNCKISGNGIYSLVRCYQDVTMTNCVIDASNTNTTDGYQDGIDVTAGCTATMINCTNVNGTVADLFEAEDIAGTDGKVVIQ